MLGCQSEPVLETLAGKPTFGGLPCSGALTKESRRRYGDASVSQNGVCMPAYRAQASHR